MKIRLIPVILALGAVSQGQLAAQAPALPESAVIPEYIPGQYIVTLAPGVSPADVLRGHQLKPRHVYEHALNGFAGALSDAEHARLRGDPRVVQIEPDQLSFSRWLHGSAFVVPGLWL